MQALNRKPLIKARKEGWLQPEGSPDERKNQMMEWLSFCNDKRLVYIVAEGDTRLFVQLPARYQLSSLAYLELEELMAFLGLDGILGGIPTEFSITKVSPTDLNDVVDKVRELLRRDRTPERAVALSKLSRGCAEGMARVVDPTGLWDDLRSRDLVYVREIPGRPGRCIALRHEHPPLVDLPLDNFQILAPPDV